MVRIDRQQPDIYFGRPGALVSLPWPRGGLGNAFERETFDFKTGSGQHRVSSLIGGSRQYSLSWNALQVDTYNRIDQYWTGSMGLGPWALVDPSRPNLLLTNQAAATSEWNTAQGFSTSAANHGAVTSNQDAAQVHRTGAPRSLRWRFAVSPAASPVLTITPPYGSWFGIPVQPGLAYMFSYWIKPVGDASITVDPQIQWYGADGVQVGSNVSGGATAVTAWTRQSVGGVVPAGAAFGLPRLVATGATITPDCSLYVDELMFEQDSVLNSWAPGTGCRPVEILSLTEGVPFAARFRDKPVLLLRELAT